MKRLDIVGKTFHRLTVVGFSHILKSASGRSYSMWNCRCVCGKTITAKGQLLARRSDGVKSCGCLKPEVTGNRSRTHGEAHKTPEWKVWTACRNRCENKNRPDYPFYGGRGIKVCARWCESYENFLADMGRRPSAGHSLGRVNNDGDYSPENCRWETRIQQHNNKRNNRFIEFNGMRLTLAQWGRHFGVKQYVIANPLKRGESPQQILSKL